MDSEQIRALLDDIYLKNAPRECPAHDSPASGPNAADYDDVGEFARDFLAAIEADILKRGAI